jgi:hypothetical protein
MKDSNQPSAVPHRPDVPQPHPGCDVCAALVRDWITATEPASTAFSNARAAQLVVEINGHSDVRRHPH